MLTVDVHRFFFSKGYSLEELLEFSEKIIWGKKKKNGRPMDNPTA